MNAALTTYALGHELGHAFGLSHSCEVYPEEPACRDSIMQTAKPQAAALLPEEIAALRASSFFS